MRAAAVLSFRHGLSTVFAGGPALARQLLDAGFDLSFGLRYNKESFDITPTERRYRETDAL